MTVEEGFEVFNDINGTITSNMISVFDSKNDTCVKLPVIGQTPPILWMRINTSMIWGLAPSAFQLTVIGQGISCNKHNNVTLLQVKMLHALYICNGKGILHLHVMRFYNSEIILLMIMHVFLIKFKHALI